MASPLRYFHGGVPGLRPGDVISPATKTHAKSVSGLTGAPYRRDRVYVTTSEEEAYDYAKLFVSMGGPDYNGLPAIEDFGGAVYEVAPRGPIELDPDAPRCGTSWQVAEAEVVRVVDPHVMPDFTAYMPPEQAHAAALQWLFKVGQIEPD